MRLRFAPSPTGQLHVGNARTALFNWLLARGSGGEFILRIEDTDAERSTLASETAILEDLRWLGLTWDEGQGVGGEYGPYRQSERLALYESYGAELLARSRAYYCFCSADQLESERQAALAAGLPPRYSGRCRDLDPETARQRMAAGEPAALRFRVGEGDDVEFEDLVRGRVAFAREVIGDPVIIRSDGRPAYNFAVVVDDALMKVTHVIRGEDHVSNTPQAVADVRRAGMGAAGLRASRPRDGARTTARCRSGTAPRRCGSSASAATCQKRWSTTWRCSGGRPAATDEVLPVDELARPFSRGGRGQERRRVRSRQARVGESALPQGLRAVVGWSSLATPYLTREGWVSAPDGEAVEFLAAVLPLGGGIGGSSGADPRSHPVPVRLRRERVPGRRGHPRRVGRSRRRVAVVVALAEELGGAEPMLDRDAFRAAANRVKDRTKQKGKALFHPIRLALTGESSGMELDLAVPAIERGARVRGHGLAPVQSARERAAAFARAIGASGA